MTHTDLTQLTGRAAPLPGSDALRGIVKRPVERPLALGPEGLEDDEQADRRVHGGVEKAVHHYPVEHYAAWQADLGPLAVLITGYRAAMGAGAPEMSQPEAQHLIASANGDPNILLIGAEIASGLAGFALAFDLPEIIAGGRAGQLDDLFVAPEMRGGGLARALITRLTEIGVTRGWTHMRWLVPQDNIAARQLYETLAEPAPWDSFRIKLA